MTQIVLREQRWITIYALRRHARPNWLDRLRQTTASPISIEQLKRYVSLPNPLRQHVPHENDFLGIVHGSRERDIGQVGLQAPEIETRDEHMSCRTERVKMAIVYMLVAHRSVVLAEFSSMPTTANAIARKIIEKFPGNEDTNTSY
ncbi:vesicle-associated membrane protein [Striga asiatica]|uniref:Vesicle-associated membrane protein n=1 Tax=Striga asiatica TaxID=4170 RepID=A0A5A7REJ2_STRAF|nr:vesicle-associated membrane protein [Striga asiatica]